MKISELLKAAKEKIKDERHWIKGFSAAHLHTNGQIIPMHAASPMADCFCATGAILSVSRAQCFGWLELDAAQFLEDAMSATTADVDSVEDFNDDPVTTHSEILQLYDRAIALAEAEESRT